MKALTYGLLGLALVCIGIARAEAAPVKPEPALYPRVHAVRTAGSTDVRFSGLKDAHAADHGAAVQVAMDLGAALRGLGRANINYYGYRPFGYLGYQSDAYRGYRAPGYYGYRYYFEYPVFDPGFHFHYRL